MIIKRIILAATLCLFILQPAKTQTLAWDNWGIHLKKIDVNPSGFININSFDVDSKGNTYIVGSYRFSSIVIGKDTLKYNPSDNANPLFMVKVSNTRQVLWAKPISKGSRDAILKIDKNNVIHYVYRGNFIVQVVNYAQYDTSGALINERNMVTRNDASGGYDIVLHDLVVDANNNYYTLFTYGGTINSNLNFEDSTTLNTELSATTDLKNMIILKYNSENKLIWKKVSKIDQNIRKSHLAIDNKQNVIVSGTYLKRLIVDDVKVEIPNDNTTDFYVFKLDSLGQLKWLKSYGNPVSDELSNKAVTDKNQNIFVVGTLGYGNFKFDSKSVNDVVNDPFILQLNENGITSNIINIPINDAFSAGRDVQVDTSGNIVLLGEYSKIGTIGTTNLPPLNLSFGNSFFISVLNKNFQIKSTITTTGTNDLLFVRDGRIQLIGNKVYMTGMFTNYVQLGNTQLKEIFTQNCSNCYDGFMTSFSVNSTSKLGDFTTNNGDNFLDIYPNPSTGHLFIKNRTQDKDLSFDIKVFDLMGRLIKKAKYNSSNPLELDLEKGYYTIYWYNEYIRGSRAIIIAH